MPHANEVLKFLDSTSLENIYITYPKIVGIETIPSNLVSKNKGLGKIILISGDNIKFLLGDYIEYNIDKIKWKNGKYDGAGCVLYLIDPYWCTKHNPILIIKVPIKVYNQKMNIESEEFVDMNKNQFIKNRLIEFYGAWEYRLVAAVNNFNFLLSKGYYYALNSTVKMYRIDPELLKSSIAKINRNFEKINKEWNELLIDHYKKMALK